MRLFTDWNPRIKHKITDGTGMGQRPLRTLLPWR